VRAGGRAVPGALSVAEAGDMSTPCPPRALQVLVVDDNRDAADSLALLLQAWGYEPLVACDGPSGLALAAARPPAAALIDVGLPHMDGCEVARRLRARAGTDRALLVAITGYTRDQDRQRSREAGFDHHFVKPVEPEELRVLLAALL
jgi:CheY-like chemotaxis protein